MNSNSSIWARIKYRKKIIAIGWVLCLIGMIIALPGAQIFYMHEVDDINSYGVYLSTDAYNNAMTEAVLSGMKWLPGIMTFVLAVIMPIQGFSYLFSRKQCDFFMSIPVSKKSRFLEIYTCSLNVYLAALLPAALISIAICSHKGIMSGLLFLKIVLEVILCILIYLAVFNLSIWAVMLTGRIDMALLTDFVIIGYADILQKIVLLYRREFFTSLCENFEHLSSGVSIRRIFLYTNSYILNPYKYWEDIWQDLLWGFFKLAVWGILGFIIATNNYHKRKAEAAETVVAFYSSKILIKILISVPAGLLLGMLVHKQTGCGIGGMLSVVALATMLVGMLLEIIFNSAFWISFKHWGSNFVSVLVALTVFGIFLLGAKQFDNYVPASEEVVSIAIINTDEKGYSEAIDFDAYPLDYEGLYINPYEYACENMELQDAASVIYLADKSRKTDKNEMSSPVKIDVLYRLEAGREKARSIWVDLDDPDNNNYLNRIIGPAYYKNGIWQALTTDIPEGAAVSEIDFYDGYRKYKCDSSQADKIISLWKSDMVGYDFNRVNRFTESGYIIIKFADYMSWTLPVYDSFNQVNSYLAMGEKIEPLFLQTNQIEQIKITDYENEDREIIISESGDISKILSLIEKKPIHDGWLSKKRYTDRYKVEITLNEGYTDMYGCLRIYDYKVLSENADKLEQLGLVP